MGPQTSESNKNPFLIQTQVPAIHLQPKTATVAHGRKSSFLLCVFATHNYAAKKDSKSASFVLLVALFAVLIPDQLKQ